MKKILSLVFFFCLSCSLLPESAHLARAEGAGRSGLDKDAMARNRMIGYMISKQLPGMHFSDKAMDDSLSAAAFDLYLKQLDYQKRFLLQKDVDALKGFARLIDDELRLGNMNLPQDGFNLLNIRINEVEKMVGELLVAEIDVNSKELYETDPLKLSYATDMAGLREYWRKMLKEQIQTRYLDALADRKNAKEKKSDDVLWKEARERVAKQNRELFHRLHQEKLQDHFDRYFDAVARAFDPHTNYMPPDNKEDFDIHMRGSLEGIGAVLREEDGYIKVVSIVPGSVAAKQGQLEAQDIILEVAQKGADPVEITDMRLRDAVRLIRGPKGTEVRLTVKKTDGVKNTISLVRDVVQIEETFVKSTVLEAPDGGKVGYVLIPSFYRDFEGTRNGGEARNSTDDTRKAIEGLKKDGVRSMILDLRNNGGGSLVDAVDTTGLFIKSGPVVQVKNSSGAQRVLSDEDPSMLFDGPLVVLVNQFSASASEIVAAALQDYGRAVIMGGAHTHGKGTVQTLVDMNEAVPALQLRSYSDLGALKVTIQKFYRVNGGSTQYKGVESDIVLPSLFQYLKSGEQFIDYSLPWDQVAPVSYERAATRKADIERLATESGKRVSTDPGLQVIAGEASKAEERSKDSVISLELADMKKRREEADLARKKIGEHYSKYQVDRDGDPDEEAEKGNLKGDERQKWLEEIKDDPYVGEAMRVLRDMARPAGSEAGVNGNELVKKS